MKKQVVCAAMAILMTSVLGVTATVMSRPLHSAVAKQDAQASTVSLAARSNAEIVRMPRA